MQSEMKKLDALLDYLIKHNNEHVAEIMDLARQARTMNKDAVYNDLLQGVEQMKESNRYLEKALTGLRNG